MAQIEVRTKPDELCLQLTALAQRLGPGAKLPTARELSRFYAVSPTTLHVALGRVEAEGTISRKHGAGIFVSRTLPAAKHSIALVYNFGFLRASNHSPFWDGLLERAQLRARTQGEEFHLHFALPQGRGPGGGVILQNNLREEITSGALHGVLGVGLDIFAARWIEEQRVPFVAFAGPSRFNVGVETRSLVRRAVAELVRQGCQRIGMWRPVSSYSPSGDGTEYMEQEVGAFREALAANGAPFFPELVKTNEHLSSGPQGPPVETLQEQGHRTALEAFAVHATAPDGVVITDDMMTHGALTALQKLCVAVGRELQVASHANEGSAVFANHPEITLLEFSSAALVDHMFGLLEALMRGETPERENIVLEPKIRQAIKTPAGENNAFQI